MKFSNVLTTTVRCFGSLSGADKKLTSFDFGVLKVAMMIAALDGDIQDSEIQTLSDLTMKCRGATEETATKARDAAMRSAGYLLILTKIAKREELLTAFTEEAMLAMPHGFLNGSIEDIRRAFVMWIAMGMGDGEFSEIERAAIDALKQAWADVRTSMMSADDELWASMMPAFRVAYASGRRPEVVKLLADDFVARAEQALAADDEAAVQNIIKNG